MRRGHRRSTGPSPGQAPERTRDGRSQRQPPLAPQSDVAMSTLLDALDPRYWDNARLPPVLAEWLAQERGLLSTRISDLVQQHIAEVSRVLFAQNRTANNLLAQQEQRYATSLKAALATKRRPPGAAGDPAAAFTQPPPPPPPASQSSPSDPTGEPPPSDMRR